MFLAVLLSLLPSPLHVAVRRLMGARIGRGARIRFGTVLAVRDLRMGEGSRIGPAAVVHARTLEIGAHSNVNPLTIMKANAIRIGSYTRVASFAVIYGELIESSRFAIGNHSSIANFCWIEPGEGITVGDQVGIGGHTFIFTHGSWSDYLCGSPWNYGPVVIEDRVWIAWRVTVQANVTIGHDSIIAVGAVITKNVPPNVFAAGMPAKTVSEPAMPAVGETERLHRAERMLAAYGERGMPGARAQIKVDDGRELGRGNLLMVVNRPLELEERDALLERGVNILDHPSGRLIVVEDRPYLADFRSFLRRYGIRVAREDFQPNARRKPLRSQLTSQRAG
ncbi:MAG TPA: acyltransferase [Candidatus Baltobacteraceae bacterium]|nr:acyltransferase [Candidatus Baltobacteraceae bacterium]